MSQSLTPLSSQQSGRSLFLVLFPFDATISNTKTIEAHEREVRTVIRTDVLTGEALCVPAQTQARGAEGPHPVLRTVYPLLISDAKAFPFLPELFQKI